MAIQCYTCDVCCINFFASGNTCSVNTFQNDFATFDNKLEINVVFD